MPYIGKTPSKVPLTSDDIADGTVSNADLAGSITSAKITSLDATKLTGTVNNARISLDAAEIPNLDTAKVTSGTFADARISEASVTQHVTATDLTPVKNDISLLALQTAINGNMSAYGLKNSWIEQFENSTYIEALTNVTRVTDGEYLASVYSAETIVTPASASDWNGYTSNFTIASGSIDANGGDKAVRSIWASGTGDFTVQFTNTGWTNGNVGVFPVSEIGTFNDASATGGMQSMTSSYFMRQYNNNTYYGSSAEVTHTLGDGSVIKITRVSGALDLWDDGVNVTGSAWSVANNTSMYFCVGTDGSPYNTNHTSITFTTGTSEESATGSFNSTDVVPQDTTNKSSVGLVVLYKDQAGTNTLNTDIVAKVRANTGQAYQTLVLAGAGTYSDSLKIAIAPAIAVTAGQALSYEISFANQALSSKEARIYGVAMTY